MINMESVWDREETRDYLGDGVYAAFDGYSILLRINDHRNEDSEICLEPNVLERLVAFSKRMYAKRDTQ